MKKITIRSNSLMQPFKLHEGAQIQIDGVWHKVIRAYNWDGKRKGRTVSPPMVSMKLKELRGKPE